MFDISIFGAAMPALVKGAWLTLALTAWVIALGTLLAIPVALSMNSRSAGLRAAANGYVLFFRGTPSLLQIFLLYYGASQFEVLRHSPLWPVLRDPFWCVVIALGLNSASYTGKTLAAALAAVPRGMREAASVLGFNRVQAFWLIELPLAVRTCGLTPQAPTKAWRLWSNDFADSRAGQHVQDVLGEWRGTLVCDDYSGYKALLAKGVVEAGCLAPARRKFVDLHTANKSHITETGIQYFARPYEIEREVKDLDVSWPLE